MNTVVIGWLILHRKSRSQVAFSGCMGNSVGVDASGAVCISNIACSFSIPAIHQSSLFHFFVC